MGGYFISMKTHQTSSIPRHPQQRRPQRRPNFGRHDVVTTAPTWTRRISSHFGSAHQLSPPSDRPQRTITPTPTGATRATADSLSSRIIDRTQHLTPPDTPRDRRPRQYYRAHSSTKATTTNHHHGGQCDHNATNNRTTTQQPGQRATPNTHNYRTSNDVTPHKQSIRLPRRTTYLPRNALHETQPSCEPY